VAACRPHLQCSCKVLHELAQLGMLLLWHCCFVPAEAF
jgi:hypothetical protein